MSIRRLCRATGKTPAKALFFFPEENKTGIAPVKIVQEKTAVLKEGDRVTVNWAGDIVPAEILALSGKSIIPLEIHFTVVVVIFLHTVLFDC